MDSIDDIKSTVAVLEKFTPHNLHQFIQEFVVGTPEDPATPDAPIMNYLPIDKDKDWELVGCFMLYCEACGYFEIEDPEIKTYTVDFEVVGTNNEGFHELLCKAIHEGHLESFAELQDSVVDITLKD